MYFNSLDAIHMLGPLLAHWNGAFCGALAAGLLASDRRALIPLIVAGFVLLGGVANRLYAPWPTGRFPCIGHRRIPPHGLARVEIVAAPAPRRLIKA